ncbi:MAG TPA: hypothetical protein VKA21_08920 [Candidatus Binatia bacterium]|nr:hypothetical protein [Candidatus Binatia bacterium]
MVLGRRDDDAARLAGLVVHARAIPSDGRRGALEMVDRLTPYFVETLAHHALGGGAGGMLVVTVPGDASERSIDGVRRRFASLGTRGVALEVRRASALVADVPSPLRKRA